MPNETEPVDLDVDFLLLRRPQATRGEIFDFCERVSIIAENIDDYSARVKAFEVCFGGGGER